MTIQYTQRPWARRALGWALAGWMTAGAAALGAAGIAFSQTAHAQQPEAQPAQPAGEKPNNAAQEGEAPADAGRTGYWIGLSCSHEELGETLRLQLGLEKGQGLVILDTVDDAPAAKAGLQEHDILVTINGKPLADVRDLVQAVQAAKDTELKLEYIRGGKRLSVAVKPEKRPQAEEVAEENEVERGLRWLERFHQGRGPQGRFFAPRPGMVLPPGGGAFAIPESAPLPDDMSVTVTRKGKDPAKITVSQGDKTWETTEDRLDVLPKEAQGAVERMLGKGGVAFEFRWPQGGQGLPPALPGQPILPPGAEDAPRRRVDPGQDLDSIREQLRKLQEMVEDLRKQAEKK